jgi:hypothetical protein
MRYAAAVDANQSTIVEALRDLGATVHHLHQLGGGTRTSSSGGEVRRSCSR